MTYPSIQFRALTAHPPRQTPAALEGAVRAYVNKWAQQVVAALRPYPAEPAGSTYNRTGILGESWQVVPVRGADLRVFVGNTATDVRGRAYAKWVIGKQQTPQHRSTGWKRIDDPTVLRRTEYKNEIQKIYASWARTAGR